MTEIPTETLVTVFGGSGFLGRHVVRALAREGYRIRPAVRRPDLAVHLQPMGRVGQIHPVQANLRYPASVEAAVRGADVVINLVGILFERGKQRFEAVQAEGAACVAQSRGRGRRAPDPCLGARRGSRIRPRSTRAPRRRAKRPCSRQRRRRRSSAPRSCSGRRTISSTASARWRGCRRCCRWSAAARPNSSRCSSATSRRRSSRRSAATRRAARSMSSAGRRCAASRS